MCALNSAPAMVRVQFLRGLAFGLVSVVGVTIVVSIVVYLLSQVEFISIFGEWAYMVLEEMQQIDK